MRRLRNSRRAVAVAIAAMVAVPTALVATTAEPVHAWTYYYGSAPKNVNMYRGTSIRSNNGRYELKFGTNGNLQLREWHLGDRDLDHPHPLWQSDTWPGARDPYGGHRLILQSDGNLVIYNYQGTPIWWSGTWNHPWAQLRMQDDGNIVIYPNGGGPAAWHTSTWQLSAGVQQWNHEYYGFVSNTSYDWWQNFTDGTNGNVSDPTSWAGYFSAKWINWKNDDCSNPLTGDGFYDFSEACMRHDLTYKNLRDRLTQDFPKSDYGGVEQIWTGYNRAMADEQFKYDMTARCNELGSSWSRNACKLDAAIFYNVVRGQGGPGWSGTGYNNWFNFGLAN